MKFSSQRSVSDEPELPGGSNNFAIRNINLKSVDLCAYIYIYIIFGELSKYYHIYIIEQRELQE